MKQPKKLTRNQKEIVKRAGKEPADYMTISDTDSQMTIWNKRTGQTEVVEK